MKRRQFVIGGSAALGATLAARAARPQSHAETLVWGDNIQNNLDPHLSLDSPAVSYVINGYDALYAYEGSPPKLIPWLAKQHTASEDGLTWTFTLNGGVEFHDGSPLTSNDVAWSFQRLLALKRGPASVFLPILAPEGVRAVDPMTVEFRLKERYVPFLAAVPLVAVVNKRIVEANAKDGDWGQAWLATNAAGSGPYTLVEGSYQPTVQMDHRRFMKHFKGWEHNPSPVDYVRRRASTETATRINALLKGEIDATDSYLPTDQIDRINRSGLATVTKDISMRTMVLRMHNQRPPFNNINFRKALSHAFNYQGFITGILKNNAVRNPGPIPVNLWGAPKDLVGYDYDLAKAKEYLAKAKAEGAPVDRPIEIHIQNTLALTNQAAQILQQDARRIGVNLKIVPALFWQTVSSMSNPDTAPDMWSHFVSTTLVDPDNWIGQMYDSAYRGSWKAASQYANPKVDALLREARQIPDQAKRAELYEQASRIVVDDAVDIWIHNTVELRGLSKRIRGYLFNPVGSGSTFRNISLAT